MARREGTSILFYILLGLLMIDALLEMSFVAATVSFLHTRAGGSFDIIYNGGTFSLHGKPAHELADQGHTSNGAAGTAIVLVGFGGLLTFPFLGRQRHAGTANNNNNNNNNNRYSSPSSSPSSSPFPRPSRRRQQYLKFASTTWLVIATLSTLLTLAALIFTMTITSQHSSQTIDLLLASQLNNRPYPNYVAYPLLSWTPENWFTAILKVNLADSNDRALIRTKLNVMKAWRWNLIPLFLLGVAVLGQGMVEVRRWHRQTRELRGEEEEKRMKMKLMMIRKQKERDLEEGDEGEEEEEEEGGGSSELEVEDAHRGTVTAYMGAGGVAYEGVRSGMDNPNIMTTTTTTTTTTPMLNSRYPVSRKPVPDIRIGVAS